MRRHALWIEFALSLAILGTSRDLAGQTAKTEELIAAARELRAKLSNDPHRPRYHFQPPAAWMNDPNGAIFWKGRYHLFYQHNPEGGYWKWMQWGHASSADLVHWVHHPIALTPTPGGPDRDGCFSGGVVVRDGVPTFIYHGVPEGTCIATSTDDELIHWKKHPENPVISNKKIKGDFSPYDPCAWKQGDSWYALCGWGRVHGPSAPPGDIAYLFKSADLVHWQYLHPFYQSDRRWTDEGEDCAVPDFFPLGNKHVLLFASHKRGGQYYVGRYEGERFVPERHGRLNYPGGELIAPISMLDGKGRRIFFAWLKEARPDDACRAAGWAGVMTLPRILTLGDDGSLAMEPAPELETLRYNLHEEKEVTVSSAAEHAVKDVRGDSLEIILEMSPEQARECGIKVRASPDSAEQTIIVYDAKAKLLKIELANSTLDPAIKYPYLPFGGAFVPKDSPEATRTVDRQGAPLELRPGEPLRLRIFLDRSVLEVFANGRQCLAQRIYPTRRDSVNVALLARGGQAKVISLKAWNMHSVQ
jgi:sucrose-6-phosphate hydrolase SacC (GH32 family)